jgi:hypothetical protein
MRCFNLLLCAVTTVASAQQPVVPESARVESVHATSVPPYAAPTPDQAKYMRGLSTAGRGINQLKDGVNRVMNAGRDSLRLRRAGRLLSGLCGTARGFMVTGRGRMQPTAYQDSTAIRALLLRAQIDSLIRFVPSCEAKAATQPDSTSARLLAQLRAYEAALRDFRTAIGLPNK